MTKAVLFVYCFVLLQTLTYCVSLGPRHSDSASTAKSTTLVYYSQVTIADQTYSYDENGLLASYSNITVSKVTGLLYEPGNAFTTAYCSQPPEPPQPAETEKKKRSPLYPPRNITGIPGVPYIMLLPLTSCDHYSLAQIAIRYGAKGILFYGGSSSSSSITSYRATTLSIPVAYIQMSDNRLAAFRDILNFRNSTITIRVKYYSLNNRRSQTFYFVVFAFTVLVLLSLIWFVITYVRRCHSYCSRRYTRRRERRQTTRAITSLPTKKHKISKKSDDTDSIHSLDEPTCAVCLEMFRQNEVIRPLPCSHEFHKACIDPWLLTRGNCPLCKSSIIKRQGTSTTNTGGATHTVSISNSSSSSSIILPTTANSDTIQLTPTNINQEEEEEGEIDTSTAVPVL